jgi:enoyl-CoA hydratase/carnithine racemase
VADDPAAPAARLEVDDGVGVIRLDRPPANAIDLAMGVALQDAITEAGARADIGAIVVWGGPTIFAAGADIKAMAEWGPEDVRPSVDALGGACDMLERSSKPAIAAINGFALGGGLELALACDLRYMAEDAQVGQPEVSIGVIPGAGGTQRLVPLVGVGRTRDLVYTGRRVASDEAIRIGLVERVVPSDAVFEVAVADARLLANGPRRAIAHAKRAIRAALTSPGPEGIRIEREAFVALFGTSDQREGMAAFLEKRSPRFGRDG